MAMKEFAYAQSVLRSSESSSNARIREFAGFIGLGYGPLMVGFRQVSKSAIMVSEQVASLLFR